MLCSDLNPTSARVYCTLVISSSQLERLASTSIVALVFYMPSASKSRNPFISSRCIRFGVARFGVARFGVESQDILDGYRISLSRTSGQKL